MPRPASILWSHFRKDATNKRAICKYCEHNMCGLVTRMRTHLVKKCANCPLHIKQEMYDTDFHRKMDLNIVASTSSPAHTSLHTNSKHHTNTHHHLQSHKCEPSTRRSRIQSASIEEKHDLDSFLAKGILGAALPIDIVENPAFIKMMKSFHPMYDLPSAFTLATTGVDLEYTEVQLKLRAEVLDASSVCLGIESWSNVVYRSIISCMIYTPTPGMFAFENTGELPHTPQVLIDKIEAILTQIGSGKVSVIVMDGQENMKQCAIVLEEKYPEITFLPSCAHALQKMVQEILQLSPFAKVFETCKEVTERFSKDPVARAAFLRVQEHLQALDTSSPLSKPDESCPLSILEFLVAVERSRHSFDIFFAETGTGDQIEAQVKEVFVGLEFWEELSSVTGLMDPFLQLLRTLESDYPLLSTFYHHFTLLWDHLEKYGSLAASVQLIVSKFWQSIRHPAMYTAYLLDPRFPPSNLSSDVRSEVLTYLKRLSDTSSFANLFSELTRFTGRVGMFADEAIWDSARKFSPIQWWKGFIGSSCPNLQAVALRTLCFPATSGLSKSKRDAFEKIHVTNTRFMNEDQANKAALVYLNTNFSSAVDGLSESATLV